MKKLTALFLTVLLALSLVGCGRSASMAADAAAEEEMVVEAPAEYAWNGSESVTTASGTGSAKSDAAQKPAKIVYRANFELQTLDFDTAQSDIARLTERVGGYFENKSMSNYSSDYRSASYTVRVPAEQYESFCNQVGTLCHVVWSDSSAENISESYYDTEARLETAKIKLERLQELLGKAADMADIITLESAISDTEYEIDSLSGALRNYDSLVDYSTVYLSLNEVYKLSGTEDAPKTFGEKLGSAFRSGLTSAAGLLEDIALWLAASWLLLLIWAAIVIAAILLVRRIACGGKKAPKLFRRKKAAASPEDEAKE